MSDVEPDYVKILLLGLNNVGKTSILLTLTRNTNILSYFSLKPTTGIKIENIEDKQNKTIFNVWDCGGQEKYRNKYLEDLTRIFTDVNKLIYVMDIQNNERYDLALEYLSNIVKYIEENAIKLDFSIFFHKFDPGLENRKEYDYQAIAKNLIQKINKIMPSNIRYQIFKTSISTIFRKELIL